ncbi:corA-like mg2+ transporter protein [Sarocladium implicatum]|nr:corA-like mg2+ transporter protein [Sarocladium implicatum]
MAGLSLVYLPSTGLREPVHERFATLPLHNRPLNRRPSGAAILVAEYDDERAINTVRSAFGDFPSGMIDSISTNSVFHLPQAQTSTDGVPEGLSNSLSSVLRFQGLDGDSEKYSDGFGDATADEISRDAKSITTVGTWIRRGGRGPAFDDMTLILLVIRPQSRRVQNVAERVAEWFQEHPLDLLEMKLNPLFIYVALYYCFNSFTTLLLQYENLYGKVALLQERNTSGVFARTYQCNKCLVSMSYCQQDILAHTAALKNLQVLVEHGSIHAPRDVLNSNLRLQQDLSILQEDLEDFKTKLSILAERIQATLDLDFNLSSERLNVIVLWFTIITVIFTPLSFVASVFSVVETDPLYFFIALMLTLVVSLGVVAWLYSSVMQLGQGLRRRDLHKLIYHLPYKDKLGFPSTPSVDKNDERISGSAYEPRTSKFHEKSSHRHSQRRTGEHSYRVSTVLESSSSSSSGSHPPLAHTRPAMDIPPYPPYSPAAPGAPEVYVTSASQRKSAKKRRTSTQKKQQSNMGSLSYTRRPTKSTLNHEGAASYSYPPPPPPPPTGASEAWRSGYERGEPSSSTARPRPGPPPPRAPPQRDTRYPEDTRPIIFEAEPREEKSSDDEGP